MSNLRKGQFANDLLASVVVFLVALPLCMGIAIASGVSPAKGLLSGMIGGVVVGMLAGAPLQVSGPAAGLVVIVWDIVRDFGIERLGLMILAAGVMQILGGVLRVGSWFRAVSPAVVSAMLAGIGILIFASQFHVMVDDAPRPSGVLNLISIPEAVYKGVVPLDGSSHHVAAQIGILTIGCMLLWTRYRPGKLKMLPAPLVGVLVATAAAASLRLPIHYVQLPESFWDAVETPAPEVMASLLNPLFLLGAFGLAFVASAESLLSAVAVDRLHSGPRANFEKELVAQGVGNTLAGLLGALPITGVIVRSSANVEAGAQTRLSTLLHGLWLLLLVLVFPQVLSLIPTSALAAILVYTGYKLVNIQNAKTILRYGRIPFAIYLATILVIVGKDLLTGVVVGVILTTLKLIYKVTRLWIRVETSRGPGIVDLYLEGNATFLRLPHLARALEQIPPGSEVHLHIQRLLYVDHSCIDLIRSWDAQQRDKGTRLVVEWSELEQRYHTPMEARAVS
jgi:MFS superfamily sulfate permease-like transporter